MLRWKTTTRFLKVFLFPLLALHDVVNEISCFEGWWQLKKQSPVLNLDFLILLFPFERIEIGIACGQVDLFKDVTIYGSFNKLYLQKVSFKAFTFLIPIPILLETLKILNFKNQ